jgi:hypothetical protein
VVWYVRPRQHTQTDTPPSVVAPPLSCTLRHCTAAYSISPSPPTTLPSRSPISPCRNQPTRASSGHGCSRNPQQPREVMSLALATATAIASEFTHERGEKERATDLRIETEAAGHCVGHQAASWIHPSAGQPRGTPNSSAAARTHTTCFGQRCVCCAQIDIRSKLKLPNQTPQRSRSRSKPEIPSVIIDPHCA